MTQEEFIKVLGQGDHSYKIIGDRLIVTGYSGVDLGITDIPSGIEFANSTYVYLDSLEKIPSDIKFKNSGSVSLSSLTSIPRGISFENGRGIFLDSLGIDSRDWEGNIDGINTGRILNKMIADGLFDKER